MNNASMTVVWQMPDMTEDVTGLAIYLKGVPGSRGNNHKGRGSMTVSSVLHSRVSSIEGIEHQVSLLD